MAIDWEFESEAWCILVLQLSVQAKICKRAVVAGQSSSKLQVAPSSKYQLLLIFRWEHPVRG